MKRTWSLSIALAAALAVPSLRAADEKPAEAKPAAREAAKPAPAAKPGDSIPLPIIVPIDPKSIKPAAPEKTPEEKAAEAKAKADAAKAKAEKEAADKAEQAAVKVLEDKLAKAKIDPEKILDAYVKSVEESKNLADAQRTEVLAVVAAGRKDKDARNQAITEALRLVSPDFGAALVALADEKTEEAAAKLLTLMKSNDVYLAADSAFYLAQAYVADQRYEEALPLLEEITTGKHQGHTLNGGEALFLEGVTLGKLLQRKAGIKALEIYLKQNPDAPERMRVGAEQQIAEFKLEAGSLVDVEGRMDYARRRLDLEKADKPTQEEQKRVIVMLDKLIEAAEEKEKSGGGGGGGGPGGKKPGSGGPGGMAPGSGAKSSSASPGQANVGELHRINRGTMDEKWGGLKKKEREEVLAALKAKYPDRYQQLVEQYYKSLQDEANKDK